MANAAKPARLVAILELQIFEEKTLAECATHFGVSKQALTHQIESRRELYDTLKEEMLKTCAGKIGSTRRPPFRMNPAHLRQKELEPTNWHDAKQGFATVKNYCATFHADNENRIAKSASDLGLTQSEYTAQLANHLGQIPDFARLEDTLNRAIDILSGITYRKFEALCSADLSVDCVPSSELVAFTYCGNRYAVDSWASLFETLAEILITKHNKLHVENNPHLYEFVRDDRLVHSLPQNSRLIRSAKIWIVTRNPDNTVKSNDELKVAATELLKHFDKNPKDLRFEYHSSVEE